MSDPLNPYPGSMKKHTVIEGGRAAGKNAAIISKQAELIQQLLDALSHTRKQGSFNLVMLKAMDAADAQGFKPTEQ